MVAVSQRVKIETPLYGKNAIEKVLADISFPNSKQELLKLIGDKQIEYRKGYLITFREAIRNCFNNQHIFCSKVDVVSCISTYLDSMGLSERSIKLW